ncbi:MAG: LVIVD repeat-containing protein [Candidatus Hodarchaeota archaeon]
MKYCKLNIVICIVIIFFLSIGLITPSSFQTDMKIELTKLGQVSTGGEPYDLWVNEDQDIAYVTCGYFGLRIFDVSSPSNPIELSHVAETTAVINTGHATGYAHQLLYDNEIVYVGDGAAGLTIINCSDLTNPYIITHYTGGYAWDIQIINNIAFVASGFNTLGNPGVMILNITDPANPILLYNYQTSSDVNDVEIAGNRGYLASNSGFKILDISNSSNPIALGEYEGPSNSYAIDVEISGNLAYLSLWKEGLKILDISNPADITIVSEFKGNEISEYTYFHLNEEYVYLATMANGVLILDVSDPNFPTEVSRYNDTGKAYGIFVRNDIIYVADQAEGLKILKMETLPSETDTATTSSFHVYLSVLVLIIIVIRKRKP